MKQKRKRGAQPGNQNARKHGFYAGVLDSQSRADFKKASSLEGIDDEVALLRSLLEKAARSGDYNAIGSLLKAMTVLEKLQTIKNKIYDGRRENVKQAIINLGRNLYAGWTDSAVPHPDIIKINESKRIGLFVAKDVKQPASELVSCRLTLTKK